MSMIRGAALLLFALWVLPVCSPASSDGDGDADGDADADGESCTEGEFQCFGAAYQECHGGEWVNAECDGVCAEDLGCVDCRPGDRFCEDNTVMECNDSGTGGEELLGVRRGGGRDLQRRRLHQRLRRGGVQPFERGCEYWVVDLDNAENDTTLPGLPPMGDNAAGGQFAVAVANTDLALTAHVTAEINTAAFGEEPVPEVVAEVDVAPGELTVLELPRRDADGDNVTTHVDDGPQTNLASRAFRIQSSAPVVAYQFNPINQAFSNDASLLLPTSGLDTHHIVLGYPPTNAVRVPMFDIPPSRAYVTVLGTEPDTEVEIIPTSRTFAGAGVPQLQPGESYTTTLGPYDMLNLETDTVALAEATNNYPDLTGTVVRSSKPVAVFFGTDLSVVAPLEEDPDNDDSCCAEHLESQILPSSAMGQRFVITRSPPRSNNTPAEVDVYRVMAVVDDTQVTTNLSGEAASFSLSAGEFYELQADHSFVLESTQPVHVGQFLISQGYVGDRIIGDPSFVMFPAVEEWRGAYIFTTGRGFAENWVSIAVPADQTVTLDGVDVRTALCESPTSIGEVEGTSYEHILCPIDDGAHRVDSGEVPVGVTVYGYYNAGSYGYSAGSELHQIFLI